MQEIRLRLIPLPVDVEHISDRGKCIVRQAERHDESAVRPDKTHKLDNREESDDHDQYDKKQTPGRLLLIFRCFFPDEQGSAVSDERFRQQIGESGEGIDQIKCHAACKERDPAPSQGEQKIQTRKRKQKYKEEK